ncbi:hypothetical protein Clacol_009575 [Clathrus columnatus]|uniref:Uncharacterized protein n=1 Tax=Clathrus columnatus TaxID=1419009 RepID=A0AAV5AL01_9AGAM|nr:hypothetical protein Clacol_009575 [Clathrus columnatus]
MLFTRASFIASLTAAVLVLSTFTQVLSAPLTSTKVLPFPGTSGPYKFAAGEKIFASKISQQGQTTKYQIIDSFAQPTPHATTFTMLVSPTQIELDLIDEAAGFRNLIEDCSVPAVNGQTHCSAITIDNNGIVGSQAFDTPLGSVQAPVQV